MLTMHIVARHETLMMLMIGLKSKTSRRPGRTHGLHNVPEMERANRGGGGGGLAGFGGFAGGLAAVVTAAFDADAFGEC